MVRFRALCLARYRPLLIHALGLVCLAVGTWLCRSELFFGQWLNETSPRINLALHWLVETTRLARLQPAGMLPGLALLLLAVLCWLPRRTNDIVPPEETATPRSPVLALSGASIIFVLFFLLERFVGVGKAVVFGWLYLTFITAGVAGVTFRSVGGRSGVLRILRSPETWFALAATLVVFLFYAFRREFWGFTFIGDERNFIHCGVDSWQQIGSVAPTEASGCWGFFPRFLSFWQGAFLVLGVSKGAAVLSMAALTATMVPASYALGASLVRSGVRRDRILSGLLLVSLLCFSELIVLWAKIVKPHAAFVPTVVWSVYLYLRARRSNEPFSWILAGAVAGLGTLMTSLSVVLAIAAIGSLAACDWLRRIWKSRRPMETWNGVGWIMTGFLLAGAPVLVQLDYWKHVGTVSSPVSQEGMINRAMFWPRVWQAVTFPAGFFRVDHFTWREVIDPFALGIALLSLAFAWRYERRALSEWSVVLAAFAIIVGGVCQYPSVSVTRMHCMAFPFAVLACLGIPRFLEAAGTAGRALVVLCMLVVPLFTYWKIHYVNPLFREHHAFTMENRFALQRMPDACGVSWTLPGGSETVNEVFSLYGISPRYRAFSDDPNSIAAAETHLRHVTQDASCRCVIRAFTGHFPAKVADLARQYACELVQEPPQMRLEANDPTTQSWPYQWARAYAALFR